MKSWVTSPHGLTVFSEDGDLVAEFSFIEAMKIAEHINEIVKDKALNMIFETNHFTSEQLEDLRSKGII
jgi:hypothetical protein